MNDDNSKSVYKNCLVEFSIYTNHNIKKTLTHKFIKEIEFFEDTTEKEIREDLKQLSKKYEGTNFKCNYKIINIKDKKVEWKRTGNKFKRVKETYLI